jgi:hypothetical protein
MPWDFKHYPETAEDLVFALDGEWKGNYGMA